MDNMANMDKYAVFGDPIEHSLSPFIHQFLAKETNQEITYTKILSPPSKFNALLHAFIVSGAKGCNVTAPCKTLAFKMATEHHPRAIAASAANTLSFTSSGIIADNTDGIGLIRDFSRLNIPVQQSNILLLGAGGASKGILPDLLQAKPNVLVLANRDLASATERFSTLKLPEHIKHCTFNDIPNISFDLIINATAAGFFGQRPAIPASVITPSSVCYDCQYGKTTPFLKWATTLGCKAAYSGIGMLIEQAAAAFNIWRNVTPTTGTLYQHPNILAQTFAID